MSEEEVRYHYLRPAQVVARRESCPVAYVPIGTIEWHGEHNPLGADTLQAEALAIRCAREGGGLVMPALYYGESRCEGLMEANAADRKDIAAKMHLTPDNFLPDRQRFTPQQQYENYQRLLIHILTEMETRGFKMTVLIAGHYPLIDHARAAASIYHQIRYDNRRWRVLTWVVTGYELVRDVYDYAGDHAGGWETSKMLAIAPETVDLSLLPPKPATLIGAHGRLDPRDANAEIGKKALKIITERVVAEVKKRLENPDEYRSHGVKL
jgi:creatinine amidohydrolase